MVQNVMPEHQHAVQRSGSSAFSSSVPGTLLSPPSAAMPCFSNFCQVNFVVYVPNFVVSVPCQVPCKTRFFNPADPWGDVHHHLN